MRGAIVILFAILIGASSLFAQESSKETRNGCFVSLQYAPRNCAVNKDKLSTYSSGQFGFHSANYDHSLDLNAMITFPVKRFATIDLAIGWHTYSGQEIIGYESYPGDGSVNYSSRTYDYKLDAIRFSPRIGVMPICNEKFKWSLFAGYGYVLYAYQRGTNIYSVQGNIVEESPIKQRLFDNGDWELQAGTRFEYFVTDRFGVSLQGMFTFGSVPIRGMSTNGNVYKVSRMEISPMIGGVWRVN